MDFNIGRAANVAPVPVMSVGYGGNVGIGTTSPQSKLQITTATAGTIASTVAAGTNAGIYLEDNATPTDNYFVSKIHNPGNSLPVGGIKFAVSPDGTNYSWAGIKGLTTSSGNAGVLAFYTSANNSSGDGSTERARIDASGNLMVGAGSTSTRTVLTPDAVFQSYYSTEAASRIHLGRDVGIGGGAGVAFGGGGGYSLMGTDNTSGTNLYFNAGSNAVGSLTTGYQLMINGSIGTVIVTGAGGMANKGILQFSTQASTYQLMGGNNIGYLGYKSGGYHRWFGTSGEVMRIDSSGNMLVGTQSAGTQAAGGVAIVPSTDSLIRIGHANGTGSGSLYMQFSYNSSALGSISQHGTSQILFNTTSDYRLKENVVPMTGSIDRLKALKPSQFNFITDSGNTVDGFLAHEVQAVVPEAISGTKDAMKDEEYEVTAAVLDDEGIEITAAVMGTHSVPDMQGIDQSKLVPLLTAAIQEQQTLIEALTARITALEG
tara:strand:+ start:28 stop:1491 length:1464 start_codon:yes stop_codon:yes gene_type:complete